MEDKTEYKTMEKLEAIKLFFKQPEAFCPNLQCRGCPYDTGKSCECIHNLRKDTHAYIKQNREKIAQWKKLKK
jgi:hypothetical protein